MVTISQRLDATNGRPAGFDYLRVTLATTIVLWHTVVVSYGDQAQTALSLGFARPGCAFILPSFFALSGFLVAGSLERSRTLLSFLGLRVIRLVPALLVESLIAMIVLGPLFTRLTLRAYVINPEVYHYLGNVVGDIHYYLPGVFTDNPNTRVNGQLWTLPYEIKCYYVIAAVTLIGGYRIRGLLIALCLAAQTYVSCAIAAEIPDPNFWGIVEGRVLINCFLWGVVLYRLRDTVPHSRALFAACLLLSVYLLEFHVLGSLAALPVAYVTVYLGLLNPARSRAISSGDYTYGIFLYGFPIQQAVSTALPNMRVWWFNLIIALPLTIGVAYASWHLIEKRALKLRPMLLYLERHWLPVSDTITRLCGRLMPSGLRARWVPARVE